MYLAATDMVRPRGMWVCIWQVFVPSPDNMYSVGNDWCPLCTFQLWYPPCPESTLEILNRPSSNVNSNAIIITSEAIQAWFRSASKWTTVKDFGRHLNNSQRPMSISTISKALTETHQSQWNSCRVLWFLFWRIYNRYLICNKLLLL